MIAVSIVSHGHGAMVERLVSRILEIPDVAQVIVTKNIPELLSFSMSPKMVVIENGSPRGFGQNHNSAFKYCRQPFFCPINPDIEIIDDPFPILLSVMESTGANLSAPLVFNALGAVEDSARRFPKIRSLLRKFFFGDKDVFPLPEYGSYANPEWVAGMFMLFRSDDFSHLNGFDETFYLYYEDVDICIRLWQQGGRIVLCRDASVVHDARRDSHKSIRYMRLHLFSMARYFAKYWGRLPRI